MTPGTAYIDMEFAGIYGTHQSLQIPIEIGVVIHQTETDCLSFAGKPFSREIEVELWKNKTDTIGKRVEGQRRVFCLASPSETKTFDRKFHLDTRGRKEAFRTIAGVNRELRTFMQGLNERDIGTLVFFASRRELETFRQSGISTEGFLIRDLQDEIRARFHLKEHVSLDRVSLITRFGIARDTIRSTHFSYILPEKFRYLIKPHKAIGDAARMFLADREFRQYPEEFRGHLKEHVDEYERRRLGEKTLPDGGNGQI